MNLLEELLSSVKVLEANRIRYALVGGLAVGIYVEPRATDDIDFLLHPEDWAQVIEVLRPLNWLELAGAIDFAAIRIRRLTKIEDADVLVTDFLLADGELGDELTKAYSVEYHGESIRVARPETLIRLKTPRMSNKDRLDIAALEEKLKEQL